MRANRGSCGSSIRANGQSVLKIRGSVERTVAEDPDQERADPRVEALARDALEDVADLAAAQAGADDAAADLDPVGEPHQLDLGTLGRLIAQRVVLSAGLAGQGGALGRGAGVEEELLGDDAALVGVDAPVRERRVDAGVVQKAGGDRKLAVELQRAPSSRAARSA